MVTCIDRYFCVKLKKIPGVTQQMVDVGDGDFASLLRILALLVIGLTGFPGI